MMNLFIPINIPTTLTSAPRPSFQNIVLQIQLSVSSRICNISSNQSIFNSSIPMYKEAPTKSGFNDDIIYTPEIESENSERNKNRNKKKIIWFNQPYSLNVETNIGKTFLKLVKKHFPRNYSFQQEHH